MTAVLGGLAALVTWLASSPVAADTYRIGSGDVLGIEVPGHPELSLAPTVRLDGRIELPGIEPVAVVGLAPAAIASRLTERLGQTHRGIADVRVTVLEYNSRFVTVEGTVARPGRVPLRGDTRLIDVLVEAGGFTTAASGQVVVRRYDGRFADGSRSQWLDLGSAAQAGRPEDLALPVSHGDVVVALRMEKLAVGGEVNQAGVFEVSEARTLLAALDAAGGTTRYARSVELKRHGSETPEIIDLGALRRGEYPDPSMGGGDSVTVR